VNVIVENPAPVPPPAAFAELLIQRARGDTVQATHPLPTLDENVPAPWFRFTRWHEAVRAYPEEDVLALFDDRIDASDVGIVACLKNYFETTSKMLQDAQYNEYVGDFHCFSWLFS
jgi:hypothetical protein